jgi:putative membrane protein
MATVVELSALGHGARDSSLLACMSAATASEQRQRAVSSELVQRSYTGNYWLPTLFMLRGRALDRIALPWLFVMAFTFLWSVPVLASGNAQAVNFEQFQGAFQLVLTTLSFLLVFRLNHAALRFWSCRQMWGKLVEVVRQLACCAATHCSHAPEQRDALCAWACAFAVSS